jgi:hypothetical protein
MLPPAPALAQHEGHAGAGMATHRRPPPLAMGAAFAPNGELWITALDERQRLFIQTTSDEGRNWSKPRVIDTGTDTVIADGESRPKLAFGPQGQVVIAYSEPLALPYTGRIRMLRSEDEGRSFSPPFTVHQDQQVITHRFESVAFDARGTLHTLWVDKRDPEALTRAALAAADPAASAAVPTAAPGPPGRRPRVKIDYRGAAIYRNESVDGGRTFGPDTKLADYTCECCRIALAEAPDGSLVALWRHVFEPNQRDHAFAHVGGPARAEPVRATFDRWAIDACPHHGPGLSPAQGGGYHAVWFGLRAGDSRVRYGRLLPDGSPDGDALALPDDKAEHAAILSAGPQVAVLWRSFDGHATALRAWVSGDDGRHFVLKDLARSASDNDHPLLARRGSQIFALWRTTEGVRVERLAP